MNDLVKPSHTQRTAFVYIRQSSPAQVEYNSPGLLQAISSRLMRPKHEREGQQAMCGYSPTHVK